VIKFYPSRLLLFVLFFSFCHSGRGQARLILNGGKLNISNGATLVMDNAAANAITRIDGHIISEGENNSIKWLIGETTGSYTVPWGVGNTDYLPLSFTKSSGTGNGNFVFSTYGTGWQNSLSLPTDVSHVENAGYDNSAYLVDRFAQGYSVKPGLNDLRFGYLDIEHSRASNTITENLLVAQRWNEDINTWGDYSPTGTADVNTNTVTLPTVDERDLFKWWVLTDETFPLPLHFLSFNVQRIADKAKLLWTTADENNVSHFEIQRSYDGIHFITIGTTNALGGSTVNYYEYTDDRVIRGQTYYRIKEIDYDAHFMYSVIRSVIVDPSGLLQLYPNPVVDNKIMMNTAAVPRGAYMVSLFDLQGKRILIKTVHFNRDVVMLDLNTAIVKGVYLLQITGANKLFSKTVIIK
jgi:hypothetical protein